MSLSKNLLLFQLLTRDVDKRLGSGPKGSENVKKHPFFSTIDWVALEKKQVKPPFKPNVRTVDDISQIDDCFTKEVVQDSYVESGALSGNETTFKGYTYDEKFL